MPLTSKKSLDKQYCLICGVFVVTAIMSPGFRVGLLSQRSPWVNILRPRRGWKCRNSRYRLKSVLRSAGRVTTD
jgi:hypothetical protein